LKSNVVIADPERRQFKQAVEWIAPGPVLLREDRMRDLIVQLRRPEIRHHEAARPPLFKERLKPATRVLDRARVSFTRPERGSDAFDPDGA
jgi:hypothetical protein